MDCNKDEAILAKGIAENKMLNKDFTGARRIVLKAQQLYPDIENASQMLTVCDVHISAANKVNGEIDWYGVLQVEMMAEESIIKKQYRKLALLLHPDKNKFAGAEAAFKLIGEAHMILSDRGKRSLHDMKRTVNYKATVVKRQQSSSAFVRTQAGVSANATRVQFNGPNQYHYTPPTFSNSQTFWTICPSCKMRYQYYMNILNRPLHCQSCLKAFIAKDMNAHIPHAGSFSGFVFNNSVPSGNQLNGYQSQHTPNAAQNSYACSSSSVNVNSGGGPPAARIFTKSKCNPQASASFSQKPMKDGEVSKEKDQAKAANGAQDGLNIREHRVKASGSGRKRSRKQVVSSGSESSDSDDSVTDDFISAQLKPEPNSGSHPRRSSRQKKDISYNEDISDDDAGNVTGSVSMKRLRKSGSFYANAGNEKISVGDVPTGDKKHCEDKSYASLGVNLPNSNIQMRNDAMLNQKIKADKDEFEAKADSDNADTKGFCCAETEFYDFEKNKTPDLFAADQIWALYDSDDGMPRFYAKIRHVLLPKFKLRFTWLEYDPASESELEWVNEELPVACGKYKLGSTEHSENLAMFSHQIAWKKGPKRNSFEICPRRGEVWALFKGWTTEWKVNAAIHRVYEYEIVEVVYGPPEGSEIIVVQLFRVEGFVSLFARASLEGTLNKIPADDMLRFSHMIPSYRLTGNEREGIPRGCLELDTASLPVNFSDILPSISVVSISAEFGKLSDECTGLGSKTANVLEKPHDSVRESTKFDQGNGEVGKNLCGNRFDHPYPEFHNFKIDKSCDKLQKDQIWALYSDVTGFPDKYVLIMKVQHDDFKVHLVWLEDVPQCEEEKRWIEKGLPVGCGRFKALTTAVVFENFEAFSFLVDTRDGGEKDSYEIYPSKGQIWALYKNWNACWTGKDLVNCQYDLVEIMDKSTSGFHVTLLRKVEGYNAVFGHQYNDGGLCTMVIDMDELLRFSHRIPAYRLTEENDGKLRGFWELDPASVPVSLFAC